MKVSRVSEMQQLDKTAIDRYGISDALLMENAGLAVASILQREIGFENKKFMVVCGMGNNGGDGFVVARKIYSNGGIPKVLIMGSRDKYKHTAEMNLKIIEKLAVEIIDDVTIDNVRSDVMHCDVIVDAIFGTGLTRPVEGKYSDMIHLINRAKKPVVSVDIPSGINGDTGEIMGIAVKADHTITFGLPKLGNMFYPGYGHCGKLYVSHISFPPEMLNDFKIRLNPDIPLPPRNPDFHKSDFGHLLCIAGASGYYGAPYFAAMSFLKAGGGYARLAAPKSMIPHLAQKGSEIVFIPQAETDSGSISLENKNALLSLCDKMDMVIIGPGLSLNEETKELVKIIVETVKKPVLIDGDGIAAICENPGILKQRSAETILTPHMGEMSRLTGLGVTDINADKVNILQKIAKELDAVVVLKGAHSLIGCPDQQVFINMSGNAGMASAGSGDVLTGTIGAMVTAGLCVTDAVCKGVFLHGLAGDLAALEKGEDGMTAQDILDFLPMALKNDRRRAVETLQDRYQGIALAL